MPRFRFEIQGHVQGVGFRPHVFRVARELGLTGWVKNSIAGVVIEVQGEGAHHFEQDLKNSLPPLVEIQTIKSIPLFLNEDETAFVIKESETGAVTTKIFSDTAPCEFCLQELFDPQSRYFHYPFVSCPQCGPRYTLTECLPYDRENTSMKEFVKCESCLRAYRSSQDRRFHDQTIACKQCGPQLSHSFADIAAAILAGKIVAIKGTGGYQLICDANNPAAILRLRKNKQRPTKPFAIMVLNAQCAAEWVHCDNMAEQVLISRERPIVLLHKNNNAIDEHVAPHLNTLGIMLPNSGLHYLLFHALLGSPEGKTWLNAINSFALIVTSANLSGAPLIKSDDEAREKLLSFAELVVSYNREISARADDSVVKIIKSNMAFVRRARGFVPRAILLPYDIPPTLALGAHLKNTICITRGREAFISQHIGDLSHRDALRFYHETIAHLSKILAVKPACIAHDFHPDFYSTQIANQFNVPCISVQHHHAHLAACAAEHGVTTAALGIALDGFGLGENKASWGGELIHYQGADFQHLGSLHPILQPSGENAIKQPWRMAVSVLFELGMHHAIRHNFGHYSQTSGLIELLGKKIGKVTSSCGRLFDAASALVTRCHTNHYEGEAAMMLESKVTQPIVAAKAWSIENNQLNLLPLFRILFECDSTAGANIFHGTLAAGLVEWIKQNAERYHLNTILMSGGCFLNQVLSEQMLEHFEALNLNALLPHQCPPNDGGISLGQAWIAGNTIMQR